MFLLDVLGYLFCCFFCFGVMRLSGYDRMSWTLWDLMFSGYRGSYCADVWCLSARMDKDEFTVRVHTHNLFLLMFELLNWD